MPKIYESPDGGKTIKSREIRDPSSQMEYTYAKMHTNSPYNDGWTQEHYQNIVDKYENDEIDRTPLAPPVNQWVLPVQKFFDEEEYFITLPEDLLKAANLKEGDLIEWIDNGDGSCKLKKVEEKMTYDELIAAGWVMTADGFWIKE